MSALNRNLYRRGQLSAIDHSRLTVSRSLNISHRQRGICENILINIRAVLIGITEDSVVKVYTVILTDEYRYVTVVKVLSRKVERVAVAVLACGYVHINRDIYILNRCVKRYLRYSRCLGIGLGIEYVNSGICVVTHYCAVIYVRHCDYDCRIIVKRLRPEVYHFLCLAYIERVYKT